MSLASLVASLLSPQSKVLSRLRDMKSRDSWDSFGENTEIGKHCAILRTQLASQVVFVPHFPSPQSMRLFRDFGCSVFKAFRTYIDDSRSYWVINIRALALKSSFRELK